MTQIKYFYFKDEPVNKMEDAINKWLANNPAYVIKDIKIQVYCTPHPDCYFECTDIVVIYEVVGS